MSPAGFRFQRKVPAGAPGLAALALDAHVLASSPRLQDLRLLLAQVGPAQFRARLLGRQLVEAGVDRNARDPMLQRHGAGVVIKLREHLHKNGLH